MRFEEAYSLDLILTEPSHPGPLPVILLDIM